MTTEADVQKRLVAIADSCRQDPERWVKLAYPWNTGALEGQEPYPWQTRHLRLIAKELQKPAKLGSSRVIRMSTASGHGIGKSTFTSWMTDWAVSTMPNTRVVLTANTETQLKQKTGAELNKWTSMSISRNWFKWSPLSLTSTESECKGTWRADLVPWSEHKPESFAGLHNKGRRILIIFDEAAAIPRTIWETTEGALTDKDTEIIWLVFGNPTRNTGPFAECFKLRRHLWINEHIDSRSVPNAINQELIDEWERDYGEDSDFFKVRVRGVFPSASSLQFIGEDVVQAAMDREATSTVMDPIIMGVDVSRGGSDDMVVQWRCGRDARHVKVVRIPGEQTRNTMRMAEKLAFLINENKPDACFIDGGGPGGPLCDRMIDLGHPCIEVGFGNRAAADNRFANKRAEMWWHMREWLKGGGAIPQDYKLMSDLTVLEADTDRKERWLLESKESLRSRGEASPDWGDALALTFAAPVVKASVSPLSYARQTTAAGIEGNVALEY